MTQNNRPAGRRPAGQASSRFGTLDSERPAQPRNQAADRPLRDGRAAPAGRPAQGERRGTAARPAASARGGAAGTRATAPAAPKVRKTPLGPSGGVLPRGFVPLLIVCALIIVAGLVLQGMMPNGFTLTKQKDKAERPVAAQVSEIHGEGPIRLNEIMSANGGVLVDENGATPDWVEVANIGSRPANLQGYVLAKSAKAGNVFMFPDAVLQPGECAIIYADSTLQDQQGEELHAPFRLSSGGDVLMLFNDADVAVDTVNLPELSENTAYVRVDRNTWRASEQTTPGMLNTEENYRAMTSVVQNSPIQLVEVVASNSKYEPDESGAFHDYVILRNASGEVADVSGWYLSDNPRLPRLWKFPAGTSIPGGGTLLVYCSGLDRTVDPAHLHTSFRLSSEGETVTLSNASGQPVDSVTYDLLHTDEAYLRGDGGWSIGTPTGKTAAAPAQAASGTTDEADAMEDVMEDMEDMNDAEME